MRFGTRGTFKSIQAARVAAILGWRANNNHDRVGGVLFGDVPQGIQYFKPLRVRKSLWCMLKTLCDRKVDHHDKNVSIDEVLKHLNKAVPTGSLVFLISDFLTVTQSIEQQLSYLRKRCDIVFIAVNDPADQKIPPVGSMFFLNDDKQKFEVNTDSASGRRSYQSQWKNIVECLTKISARMGIGKINIATNDDVYKQLQQDLKVISTRGSRA